MAATKHPAYAVCPLIEQSGNTRTPRLFLSELAAKRFVSSEVRFPLGPEAKVAGLSVEEVRTRRGERKAKLKQERRDAANKIKSGELHPLAYPPHLRLIRNRDQGWQDPVPIRRTVDYSGPKCNRTVRDFLPVDAVGPMPAFDLREEIERALEGRSGNYTCYLDNDWRFDEIKADAWRRPGHEYSGGRHGSLGEIVVRAVHDLEAAFEKSYPNAPCRAVADFWCSWQVQLHIAEFCTRLSDSDTGRLLAGQACDAADQAERSRMYVYRRLATFAHECVNGAPAVRDRTIGANAGASAFVDRDRIDELKQISHPDFDLSKLIKLSEELNVCFAGKCYLAVAMLTRALIDHVPPVFKCRTFSEVSSNYRGGSRSFKESMLHLENSSRKIADQHLHCQIRQSESLPTARQVDFASDVDVLLSEVGRVLRKP